MGFFNKLFGKTDELGLDEKPLPDETSLDLGDEHTNPELPAHLTEPSPETPTMPGAPRTPGAVSPRDLELINSKLDTIKAILNSVDQRIANLEKIAGVETKKRCHGKYKETPKRNLLFLAYYINHSFGSIN